MLLFMDGMSHYGSAEIAHKYTSVDASYAAWSIVSEGRFGNCLKRVSTHNTSNGSPLGLAPFVTQPGYWTPSSGGVCGFAIKVDDLTRIGGYPSLGQPLGFLVPIEPGVGSPLGAGPYHIRLLLNANGTFTLQKRASTVGGDSTLANSIEGLQSGAWAYVEIKWIIDHAGYFEVRVNTIPVMTFTGDTRVTDAASFGYWTSLNLFVVGGATPPAAVTMRICDFYLADLTGGASDVKDFLGDGIIQTIFPNAPGLAAGWTPSGAVNWDMVNDKPIPDGDATYVETTPSGTRDCHQFEDIPASASVLGVHYNILARKVEEGAMTIKPIVGQGGVQYDGPTQGVASIVYDRYLTQPYDTNPATGAPWTAAEINAGQWGLLKVT